MSAVTKSRFAIPLLLLLGLGQHMNGQKKEPRTLFPINHHRAFIDISGKTVISSSQPEFVRDVDLVSSALGGYKPRKPEPWITFGEFSEGFAVVGWALCPLCRNPVWVNGIIDETGRLVIPPTNSFTHYGSFREGLAQYSGRGRGFIDHEGSVVIAARFRDTSDFSEGLASLRLLGYEKFGYVDRKGELVIPSQFLWASDFHDGLAAVKSSLGTYGFIDKTGKLVLHSKGWLEINDFSEGLATVKVEITDNSVYKGFKGAAYGYIDRTGKFVIPPRFGLWQKFSEGRALFFQTGKNHGYGFIDANGQVVIKPEFVDGKSFSEGLAAVAVKSSDDKNLWGYIDREGAWVIKPQFQNAESFNGGLAAVNCDVYRDCQAYIDTAGKFRWQKP